VDGDHGTEPGRCIVADHHLFVAVTQTIEELHGLRSLSVKLD
jgi:hypothetical protein